MNVITIAALGFVGGILLIGAILFTLGCIGNWLDYIRGKA